MGKLIHVVGNLLFQVWTLANAFLIYIVYRIFAHKEYHWIMFLAFVEIIQIQTKKSHLFVELIKAFECHKMFDEWQIHTVEKPDQKNALFCFHPHGIYSYSTLVNMHTKGTFFENIHILGSRVSLFLPISGMILRLYGIEGVDSANFKRLLKEGEPVGMLPGGFEEATLTTPRENRIYISNRKGFIKYALQNGSTIYPVFTFGETQMFNTFDKFMPLRLWLNKYKIVGTVFWSRFGPFPEPNTKVNTVCGRGIRLPAVENPTVEEVDRYHSIYIQAVKDLYSEYSPKFAPKLELKVY